MLTLVRQTRRTADTWFCKKEAKLSDQKIEIVELDRRLASDPDGIELRRLTERLTAGKGRVVQEMGRGASTDEYARLSLLAQAYDAGIDALPKLWASIHQAENQ